MQKLKIIVFLLVLATVAVAHAERSGILANDEEKAAIFLNNKEWPALLQHSESWIKREPREERAWHYRGLALRAVNNLPDAVKAFTEAWYLSSEKDNDFFLLAIGDMQAQLKNWAAAEIAYNSALQINKNSAHTWKKLVDVLMVDEQRSSKKATATAMERTLSFGEYVNDANLWRKYASLLDELGRDEDIYNAYEHVLRLQPGDIAVWERLFFLAEDLGKKEKTKGFIISKILAINKNNPLVQAHLGQQALNDDRIKIAKLHFDNAVKGGKRHPRPLAIALTGLGDMLGAGQRQAALDKYKSAVHADPTYFKAWERVIIFLRDRNQFTQADKVFGNLRTAQRLTHERKAVPKEILP